MREMLDCRSKMRRGAVGDEENSCSANKPSPPPHAFLLSAPAVHRRDCKSFEMQQLLTFAIVDTDEGLEPFMEDDSAQHELCAGRECSNSSEGCGETVIVQGPQHEEVLISSDRADEMRPVDVKNEIRNAVFLPAVCVLVPLHRLSAEFITHPRRYIERMKCTSIWPDFRISVMQVHMVFESRDLTAEERAARGAASPSESAAILSSPALTEDTEYGGDTSHIAHGSMYIIKKHIDGAVEFISAAHNVSDYVKEGSPPDDESKWRYHTFKRAYLRSSSGRCGDLDVVNRGWKQEFTRYRTPHLDMAVLRFDPSKSPGNDAFVNMLRDAGAITVPTADAIAEFAARVQPTQLYNALTISIPGKLSADARNDMLQRLQSLNMIEQDYHSTSVLDGLVGCKKWSASVFFPLLFPPRDRVPAAVYDDISAIYEERKREKRRCLGRRRGRRALFFLAGKAGGVPGNLLSHTCATNRGSSGGAVFMIVTDGSTKPPTVIDMILVGTHVSGRIIGQQNSACVVASAAFPWNQQVATEG